MLYLAQVQKKGIGKSGVLLLARQRAEYAWTVLTEEELVLSTEVSNFTDAMLVLVELGSARQIVTVQDAKGWILEIIQSFLVTGITPTFLQQETERAEQWRQSLTLQTQELDRRVLELEARREQIQLLEENLNREKKMLESMAAQLKTQNP